MHAVMLCGERFPCQTRHVQTVIIINCPAQRASECCRTASLTTLPLSCSLIACKAPFTRCSRGNLASSTTNRTWRDTHTAHATVTFTQNSTPDRDSGSCRRGGSLEKSPNLQFLRGLRYSSPENRGIQRKPKQAT